MCGIAGIVGSGLPADRVAALVAGMNRAQAHRGPDGEGIWSGDECVLGHRRLAIIDLSDDAKQPMTNEDGSLVVVVNGEIYNYKPLREKLERKGHFFKSHSDSETILHLYEEFGADCVSHLTGMFAFALWDSRQQRLLLARDRIGEKPLCYAVARGAIAFASEARALLSIPGVDSSPDPEAITCSLAYDSPPAPLTFYKGIRTVEPATTMVWQGGGFESVRKYWQIDFAGSERRWSWTDAIDRYDQLLTESVEGCFLADVPVGIYLSGGVDSSSIAVVAAGGGRNVSTFCVGRDAPQVPDPEFARALRVADILKLPHTNLSFDPADVVNLPSAVSSYGQPINQLRILLDDQLARAARREVKVALSGAGADEVFGGYGNYHKVKLASMLGAMAGRMPSFVTRALPFDEAAKWKLFATAARLPMPQWKGAMIDAETDLWARRLFTPEFYKRSSDFSPGRFAHRHIAECSPRNYVDATLYFHLMAANQHGTTVLSDVAGMTHGLEVRAPFLNHKLIEFAASLPTKFLVPSVMSPKHNKAIMKKWLSSHLPDDIVYAKKVGFGYAITYKSLMSGAWRPAAEALVANGKHLDLGIFSREAARRAVDEGGWTAFRMLVFAVWAEMFLFGETPEAVSDAIARVTPRP